jgi:hypothetical protein
MIDPNWKPLPLFNIKQQQMVQPAMNQRQRGRGGTATSLISEGGALGGAAAGALAGSVVPVIGTAIGGILGAGIGAFGGRIAENKVRDDRYGVGDAAKEGALTTVLAGPLKLGKYAGSAGKALKGGTSLESALIGAADDASKFTLRGSAGKSLANKADDISIKSFRFTPSQLTNFKKKYGEDASQLITRNGLIGKSADDFGDVIAQQQARFDELVDTAGTIKKTTLQRNLTNAYKELSKNAPSDSKAMASKVKQEVNTLIKQLPDEVSASELNIIRRQFDDLVNYTNKVADPARYGVNKRIADTLRQTIQKASGSNDLKNTGLEISKLMQLADNAAQQANRGRGSSPIGLRTIAAGGIGAGTLGPAGAVGAAVAERALNSSAATRGLANTANKLGNKLTQSASNISPTRSAVSGAIRGATGASLADAMVDAQSPIQPNQMQTNTNIVPNTMPPSNSMMDSQYTNSEDMSSGSPFDPENLENAIVQILAGGGTMKDVSEFVSLSKMINDLKSSGQKAQKPLSQGQQERADLIKALDNTEQVIGGGSINYGPLGSRVEGIKSMFNAADPETLTFKNTISGLRAAITKARAGASLTAGELKLLEKYTPSDTDSEQVVKSKLAQLRQLYGYQSPTGGSTLEDALMQYQQ